MSEDDFPIRYAFSQKPFHFSNFSNASPRVLNQLQFYSSDRLYTDKY